MANSTSDAKVYGLVILGAAGWAAYRGLTGIARYAYEAYEARTKTPQQRIGAKIEEARKYGREAVRYYPYHGKKLIKAKASLDAAEAIARDCNVQLPKSFEDTRERVYVDLLSLTGIGLARCGRTMSGDNLDGFVREVEYIAGIVGPRSQSKLEDVWRIALERHLEWAREEANRAEDRDDTNTLGRARRHFDQAKTLAAKLESIGSKSDNQLSSVEILIIEREHEPPMPYKGGF